ncbi:MAG: redoxin domain-containing protein [Acidimicrobiia bacterium]|nr:redoxin domain-containing protein [Acidimicrobiia bacterium]MDX2467602.1 redoxin domain-containing protein [Acidimicrobiia bacterium]
MKTGSPAPSFALLDQNKESVSLESLQGSKALVVFIPFPFTGICDDETCAIRDHLSKLNDMDAKVVIITVHAVPVAKKWADENGFNFPVLSDYWPHGEVAKAYGAFKEKVGAAHRYTFVLDADGIIREVINTEALGIGREFDSYVEALARF